MDQKPRKVSENLADAQVLEALPKQDISYHRGSVNLSEASDSSSAPCRWSPPGRKSGGTIREACPQQEAAHGGGSLP